MPSDNEIKQIMTEKVFPFFESGLKDVLSRLDALEKVNEKTLKELAKRKAKTDKMIKEMNDRATKKAVAKHKAEIEKEKEAREEKKQALEKKKQELSKADEEKKSDIKATVKIDDSGRAETIVEKEDKE